MKRLLKVGLVSLALAGTMAYAEADDYSYDTHSLIGIEGGYGSFDLEHGLTATTTTNSSKNYGEFGVKIGAETTNYRLFLSARQYAISGFDQAYSYGAEGQYLINVSNYMNIFVGLNIGTMNFKYETDPTLAKVSSRENYYGGDIGVNLHVMKELDVEIGARYMYFGYSYSSNGVGKFDHLINGYASLIYKFEMD